MGRYAIELDPDGYKHAVEPGFHWWVTGRDLLKKWIPDAAAASGITHNFLNPEGSEFLVCRPRQFAPLWYQDVRLADHVMRQSLWTFASGVTCVEWQPSRLPDGVSFPDNQWMSIQCPETVTSLDTVAYGALGDAAGLDLATFNTIAKADVTPVGIPFNGGTGMGMGFHPMLQLASLPPPQDVVVFGFGNLALVMTQETVVLCFTPGETKTQWKQLASWRLAGVNSRLRVEAPSGSASLFGAAELRMIARSIKVVPVAGEDRAYFYLNSNPPVSVPVMPGNNFFGSGGWWYGAAPKARILTQAQVIGYEQATTEGMDGVVNPLGSAKVLFDMGSVYKPTVKPRIAASTYYWTEIENPTEDVSGDGVDTEYLARALLTYTSIRYQLLDETGAGFPYDGTKHKGGFKLELTPGTSGLETGGDYLSPSFRCLELKFPVKLEDRANTPLLLEDDAWQRFHVEASLREPGGKRLEVDLTPAGLDAFHTSPLSERESYPVHILEDADNDGDYETIRARGWVHEPDISDLKVPQNDGTEKIVGYRLRGKGLLSRCEKLPLYLPQMVNPETPGEVSHTYAAEEVLLQCGFDMTEPVSAEVAVFAEDGYESASTPELRARAMLPGTWKLNSGEVGTRVDSPWAPQWDQQYLEYLERNAKEYVGWLLYEDLRGVVRYHPDLITHLLEGYGYYYLSGTLYRSHPLAAAAGVPGQVFAPGVKRKTLQPRGNAIRVTGKDPGNSLMPQFIDRDERSLTDTDYENFTGELQPFPVTPTLAVEEGACRQIARILLRSVPRRVRTNEFTIPRLAPHELVGDEPMGLGYVIAAQGYPRAYQVTHEEWECLRSSANPAEDYHSTRLTVDRLPVEDGAQSVITAGEAPGDWPGVGILVDES